jgi:hypothetical protein
MKPLATLAAGIAALATWPANAATYTYENVDDYSVLTLHGEIVDGDAQRLSDTIDWVDKTFNRKVKVLDLDSPGGLIGEAVKIATVTAGHANTVVRENHYCASACFIVLLAGMKRIVSVESHIGVHSNSDATTHAETVSTEASTLEMARLYSKMRVPASIVGKMVATPASEVYWLTLEDKKLMFEISDQPSATATAPAPFVPPQPTYPQPTAPQRPSPPPPIYNPFPAPVHQQPTETAPVQPTLKTNADCFVEVLGETRLNGPCLFQGVPGGRDFTITDTAGRSVTMFTHEESGDATYRNGSIVDQFGDLLKKGACWEPYHDEATRVCAWKGKRPRAFMAR